MKDRFEINLPIKDVEQRLVNADGSMSGYNFRFEILYSRPDEIKLVLIHRRHVRKNNQESRTVVYLYRTPKRDITHLKMEEYSILFWLLISGFYIGLFLLPFINTPSIENSIIFVASLLIGYVLATGLALTNQHFIYQILDHLFEYHEWQWLRYPKHKVSNNRYFYTRIIDFRIESIYPYKKTMELLENFKQFGKRKNRVTMLVKRKGSNVMILQHSTSVRNFRGVKHNLEQTINVTVARQDDDTVVLIGQSAINPFSRTMNIGIFLMQLIVISLLMLYTNQQTIIVLFAILIGLVIARSWRNSDKQQDQLLYQLESVFSGKSP